MRQRGVFIRVPSGGDWDWSFRSMVLRFLINLLGLWLASVIVPGITIDDWQSLVAGTALFAIVNTLLKPLATMLSCCLILATFGLFVVVINAAMLGLTAWLAGQLDLNFEVDGFWSAVFGALVISAVAMVATWLIRPPKVQRF
ncbi:MAG: phage holin family protein [Dehalococcoidia bacterium]